MNRSCKSFVSILLFVPMLAIGCAKHADGENTASHSEEDEHEHADEHDHAGEAEIGSDFKEDEGILLSEEATEQIGLQTANAANQKLEIQFTTTARVFQTSHAHSPGDQQRAHHNSYASAIISEHMARFLEPNQKVAIADADKPVIEGRLARLDSESATAIGQVEAIIDVPDPEHHFDFGAFLKVTFNAGQRDAMSVPKAAVLEAASGTFVYVKNGDRFLRTTVEVGAMGEEAVEIVDGLFEGDIIVTRGSVDLWLIELRFTKGGGHSH